MLAAWTQRITLFLIVPVLIVVRVCSWFRMDFASLSVMYQQVEPMPLEMEQQISALPLIGKILFFALETISTVFVLIALVYFLKLLQWYKKEIHFSKEVIGLLKKISAIIFAWACYGLLFNTIASLLISVFKPVGQRFITVLVSSKDIFHFFMVLILLLVIQVIQEAYKIKTEQDLVV